ncbi:MAG: carboxypeptidase regulatory-like domain-containing protein, partial [Ignavibacteriota bacterium]
MNKIARSFLAAIGASILVVCVTLAFSKPLEETGKIHATVVDATTGRQLDRATVQIIETKQGARTKANGEATIMNIKPGTYSLIAKYAGYFPETQKNITVTSGNTTNLIFSMRANTADSLIVIEEKLVDASSVQIHTSRGNQNSLRVGAGSYSKESLSKFAVEIRLLQKTEVL